MTSGHGLILSSLFIRRDFPNLVWMVFYVASLTSARPVTMDPKIHLIPSSPREDLTTTISPLTRYLTQTHSTQSSRTTTTDEIKIPTTRPNLVETSAEDEKKDKLEALANTRLDGIAYSSTTIPATVAQAENTVNFLALISIVAFVVIIFVTCLLVAAICPRGACFFLQPLSTIRHVNGIPYNSQQEASQTSEQKPPPPLQPLHIYKQGQRLSVASNDNNSNTTQNMNESISSEVESPKCQSTPNFCCLKFNALPGRNGHLSVNDVSVVEDVYRVDNSIQSNMEQKYCKLTHFSSDKTDREEGSSERVSVVESDSDNVTKDFCLGKRKRPYRMYRQRQCLEDETILGVKEINVPRCHAGIKVNKYGKVGRAIPRPEYFISQCPYCSCDNLMVNHNGKGLDLIGLRHVSGKSLNEDSQAKRTVL